MTTLSRRLLGRYACRHRAWLSGVRIAWEIGPPPDLGWWIADSIVGLLAPRTVGAAALRALPALRRPR
jgi:hypothetical protein